jgi:adenylosuccinate lyase
LSSLRFSPLTAISPIDGRYSSTTRALATYFSEYALIHHRVRVEVEYFIALTTLLPELSEFPSGAIPALRKLYTAFNEEAALKVKEVEKITNHDVKAIEYFVKDYLDSQGLQEYREFVHFGLTSQDINNTAVPLLFREFLNREYYPLIEELQNTLGALIDRWSDVAMLARTHGQPASPTRLGKELKVFSERVEKQISLLEAIPHAAKFGGATGNFNAHHVAYPEISWDTFADNFVGGLGLNRSTTTTQIEHYDCLAAQCDALKRINTILVDFCRDVWQYVAMNYFKQTIKAGEIGSSAMPHKVNPIDFENAEGNLLVANAMFEMLSSKLPVSRLQRDLTDSTVLRNLGVPIAHTYLAIASILRGLQKLELNRAAIDADLEDNWAVVSEAIQTVLRKEGYPNPYEALKDLTRKNEKITRDSLIRFIDGLDVNDDVRQRLKEITPFTYTGI